MTELTRRPGSDPHRKGWRVFYGDIDVGWIGERAGVPRDADQWGWNCGFYPGCNPGQFKNGTAETFELARADFEAAWSALLPELRRDAFQAWRHHQDAVEQILAMRARGEKLPSQQPSSLMRCPCGTTFDSHVLADNLLHVPHITAAQRRDGITR